MIIETLLTTKFAAEWEEKLADTLGTYELAGSLTNQNAGYSVWGLAIIAAFVGVITKSLRSPNTRQLVLALAGIMGTAIASILVFLAVVLSKNYFLGSFRCVVYPIITPIAMVLCMITVTKKHKRAQAELEQSKRQ